MTILEARNISYAYESDQHSAHVLMDLSLSVAEGEMVAVTGPSGSGKSTLLYLLSGMLEVQSGKIYVDGLDLSILSKQQLAIVRSQKLGFIFQDACLLPRANILDNILLPTLYPAIKNIRSDYLEILVMHTGLA